MFSFGNTKLPKTTATFNMTSAKNCPSRKLVLCNAVIDGKCYCYADKSERMWPSTKKFRAKQQAWWKKISVKGFCDRLIKESPKDYIGGRNGTVCFSVDKLRFNEAGDFPDQESVDKAQAIAMRLEEKYGIETYCHTSRSDLDFRHCFHLKVRGSGFTKEGLWGSTDIITKWRDARKYKDKYLCPMSCKKCDYCTRENGLVLFLLH